MEWLLVAVGAAAGAPCRWLLDQAVQGRRAGVLPVGTLVVNVLGSLLLGALLAATLGSDGREQLVALLGTGFAGAFTTFSSFAYETVVLLEDGSSAIALANVALGVVAGTAAAFAGWWLAGGAI
jgi:fluoride exporter